MAKYRIKQEVYKDGSVKYYPQYYRGFFLGWKSLFSNGEKAGVSSNLEVRTQKEALKAIELCEKGKNIVIAVTFEYINK